MVITFISLRPGFESHHDQFVRKVTPRCPSVQYIISVGIICVYLSNYFSLIHVLLKMPAKDLKIWFVLTFLAYM